MLACSVVQVPGLNGPGLVPAKKIPKQAKPEFESVREAGYNHFWNPVRDPLRNHPLS